MMRSLGLRLLSGAIVSIVGLAPTASWAGWTSRSAVGTTAEVYTPEAARADGTRSLLVVLHGCTQSTSVFRERGGLETTAEAFGMVVAVPAVPGGGVYAGCWDYYGKVHQRSDTHSAAVIGLAQSLTADAELGVDDSRVYVAGLSSGASEAMVVTCLAPDVFSGVGIVAGPTVGTEAFQIAQVATTAEAGASLCTSLAGEHAAALSKLRASVVSGSGDYIVAPGYAEVNAEVFRILRGGELTASEIELGELTGYEPQGSGTEWSDSGTPAVSLLRIEGMGHAWPAGTGPGPEISFIASEGPSYSAYLARLFEGAPQGDSEAPGDGPVQPWDGFGADDDDDDHADASCAHARSGLPQGRRGLPFGGLTVVAVFALCAIRRRSRS